MKAMRTIIGATVKRERNTEGKRNKRREAGMRPMEEYNAERREQTEDKLWQLQKAMGRYPNAINKELAEMLSMSVRQIQRLKKQLQG